MNENIIIIRINDKDLLLFSNITASELLSLYAASYEEHRLVFHTTDDMDDSDLVQVLSYHQGRIAISEEAIAILTTLNCPFSQFGVDLKYRFISLNGFSELLIWYILLSDTAYTVKIDTLASKAYKIFNETEDGEYFYNIKYKSNLDDSIKKSIFENERGSGLRYSSSFYGTDSITVSSQVPVSRV